MPTPKEKLARRQAAGKLNRKLGYITLPLLIAITITYYIPGQGWHNTADVVQIIFLPLFFLHVALSIYVFGFPAPRRTLRVFHIYFGYLTFVIVMAAQTTFGVEPIHVILDIVMYAAITVHICIAIRYGLVRRGTTVPNRGFVAAHAQHFRDL